MSQRKEKLVSNIEYLKTDDGVESEIRNKFRLVKQGESVAVIINDEASSTKNTIKNPQNTSEISTSTSFFGKIFNYLFK